MLTDEKINREASSSEVFQYHPGAILEFARAIEALVRAECVPRWRDIASAPENMDKPVIVRWIDSEGQECQSFDYTEDGCWMEWHNHAEHVEVIGGHGVSYTPPYEYWLQLPAAPTITAAPSTTPKDPT